MGPSVADVAGGAPTGPCCTSGSVVVASCSDVDVGVDRDSEGEDRDVSTPGSAAGSVTVETSEVVGRPSSGSSVITSMTVSPALLR